MENCNDKTSEHPLVFSFDEDSLNSNLGPAPKEESISSSSDENLRKKFFCRPKSKLSSLEDHNVSPGVSNNHPPSTKERWFANENQPADDNKSASSLPESETPSFEPCPELTNSSNSFPGLSRNCTERPLVQITNSSNSFPGVSRNCTEPVVQITSKENNSDSSIEVLVEEATAAVPIECEGSNSNVPEVENEIICPCLSEDFATVPRRKKVFSWFSNLTSWTMKKTSPRPKSESSSSGTDSVLSRSPKEPAPNQNRGLGAIPKRPHRDYFDHLSHSAFISYFRAKFAQKDAKVQDKQLRSQKKIMPIHDVCITETEPFRREPRKQWYTEEGEVRVDADSLTQFSSRADQLKSHLKSIYPNYADITIRIVNIAFHKTYSTISLIVQVRLRKKENVPDASSPGSRDKFPEDDDNYDPTEGMSME